MPVSLARSSAVYRLRSICALRYVALNASWLSPISSGLVGHPAARSLYRSSSAGISCSRTFSRSPGHTSRTSSSRSRNASVSTYLALVSSTAAFSNLEPAYASRTLLSVSSQDGQLLTASSTSRVLRSRSSSRSKRAATAMEPTPTLKPWDSGGGRSRPRAPPSPKRLGLLSAAEGGGGGGGGGIS